MKRGIQIAFLSFILFIFGCSQVAEQVECPKCEECTKVECPSSETIEVIKYVCSDDRVVDSKEECSAEAIKAASAEDKLYEPVTTNEEGSYINSVTLKAACNKGMNAALWIFDISVLADEINIQIKEDPSEEFKTVHTISPGIRDGDRYGVICDNCKSGDLQLKTNQQYLARIEFDLTSLFGKKQYSNEHIIDTRAESEYITKFCGS